MTHICCLQTQKLNTVATFILYNLVTWNIIPAGNALWNATSSYKVHKGLDIKKTFSSKFLQFATSGNMCWRQWRTPCCVWWQSNCCHWRYQLLLSGNEKMWKRRVCECLSWRSSIPHLDTKHNQPRWKLITCFDHKFSDCDATKSLWLTQVFFYQRIS